MGATFGNIHILNCENFNKFMIMNTIIKGLESQEYVLTNEKHSDLSIKILFSPLRKWICIYSDSLDSVSVKDIKKQAAMYADLFNTDAVASHVYDSDVLMMSLAGTRKDFYMCNTQESYKDDLVDSNTCTSIGCIKKWNPLINHHYNEWDLIDIWNSDFTYAEEKLKTIGKLLGFDEHLCISDINHVQSIKTEILNRYEMIELSFINKLKPYKITYRKGLPCFSVHSWSDIFNSNDIHLSVGNEGGCSKGFQVILSGEAINNDLFKFDVVEITQSKVIRHPDGNGSGECIKLAEARFEKKYFENQTQALIANFNDVEIPAGIEVKYFNDIEKRIILNYRKIDDEIDNYRNKTKFWIRFKAHSDEIGSGQVDMHVIPLENQKGYAYFNYMISNDIPFITEYNKLLIQKHLYKIKKYS